MFFNTGLNPGVGLLNHGPQFMLQVRQGVNRV